MQFDFSGTSGLLILDWLLPSFWLCKEVKGFYLLLHLGQNQQLFCFLFFKNTVYYMYVDFFIQEFSQMEIYFIKTIMYLGKK